MADHIAITPGSGTTVATDDVAGVHYQRVKITWGTDGTATDTSAAAPLPTVQTGALPAGDATLGRVKLTDGTTVATVRELGANDALNVAIVDGSGNQITSFGGGGSSPTLAVVSVSLTRPADTTPYTSGDVISNSTSSPVLLEFQNCAATTGGRGKITRVTMASSNNPATKLSADLFLFTNSATAIDNDNTAFTPTDTEIKDCVGVISFFGASAIGGDATSNVFYECPATFPAQGITFKCATGTASLYGVLVARNGYTPASGEEITFKLDITQS